MTGGILNLAKPAGITSHDAVERIRQIIRRRAGHGGTLDPFADGVILIGFGGGTKILPYLADMDKEYRGVLRLGEATETLDTESPVISTCPVPPLSESAIQKVLDSFLGSQDQEPPAFSAVKVGGIRAYNLARQGASMRLPKKTIKVLRLDLLSWRSPEATFRAMVSKGTYVRRLAADVADRLGTCGYLTKLTRTAVGGFSLEKAVSLDDLSAMGGRGWRSEVVSPADALGHLPSLPLRQHDADRLRHGLPPPLPEEGDFQDGELIRALGPDGELVALLRYRLGGGMERSFAIERVIAA